MSSRAILLPTAQQSPLVAQRARQRTRLLASRILIAIAVLTLASVARPGIRSVAIQVFPPITARTAHSVLLVMACAMVVLARGLRRGHSTAWLFTEAALALSVILHAVRALHLVHGPETIMALVTAAAAVWLFRKRSAFPVRLTVGSVRRWGPAVAIVAALAVALLFITLVTDVEWHRVLHATDLVLLVGFLIVIAWSLLSPVHPPRLTAAEHRLRREQAREIVEQYGAGSLDWFALRDDKDWFFSGSSVVAYSARSGVCLVSPDPIGPAAEREMVWAEMANYARDLGCSLCIVGAAEQWLPVYEASGLRAVYLGDEAVVDCASLNLSGRSNRALRSAVNRAQRGGWTTEVLDPLELSDDDRRQVLAMAGQSRHGEAERGYSMTLSRLFDPDDAGLLLSVTRNGEGRIDALCQWVPARGVNGWSLDLMRRRLDASDVPGGLMDATIVATIQEVARRGAGAVTLNFAVMHAVLSSDDDGSPLDAAVRPILEWLSKSVQMNSLSQFNEKFNPTWVPRYVLLDAAEFVAGQALVMADAEGITELPVVGRLLGRHA